jgi:hypothetical protein
VSTDIKPRAGWREQKLEKTEDATRDSPLDHTPVIHRADETWWNDSVPDPDTGTEIQKVRAGMSGEGGGRVM